MSDKGPNMKPRGFGLGSYEDPESAEKGVNVNVKNLDDNIDDERLRMEFSGFGTITSARGQQMGQTQRSFLAPQQMQQSQRSFLAPQQMQQSQRVFLAPQQMQQSQRNFLAPQQMQQSQRNFLAPQQMQQSQSSFLAPQQMQQFQRSFLAPQQMTQMRARPSWQTVRQPNPAAGDTDTSANMTEGVPCHEQLSVDGASRQSLDSQLLECPICLEQLRHPKSLPCLHSFCHECLGSYITNELAGKMASVSSFSCPVCRKVTEPVNQSEDKKSWADQFPTNNLAVEMIQLLQKPGGSVTCKPCKNKGNTNVPAKFWCELTNTYFCAACKINIHDLFHEKCEPEKVTELNKSVIIRREASMTGCGKHGEKMEYYCEDHQILGCSKCIIVDHRKCELVTSVEDFRDKLQKSSKIDDLLEELRKSADAIEILIKDVGEKLQSMTLDQDTALQSLTDIRKKIDERFDTLQKELTDNLIVSFKEEKENLDISRQKCERLMFAMQNTLTSSEDVALKDDTVGTICLFQRGKAEVESCKELIQELEKSSRSTSLKHEYDPDTVSFDTKTSLTMGKIAVHQQSRKLPSTVYSTLLSLRQLKETRRFNIKCPSDKKDCTAVGVVFLSGGRIVVGDYANQKVKLFTENGDFQCEMELTEKSCDLCRIDDNTVGVMLYAAKTICVVKVGDLTLTVSSKIQIPNITENGIGITYYNNSFVVGTSTSLYSVPNNRREPTSLHEIESRCLHLASNQQNGHVFASIHTDTPDNVAVVRLSDGTHTDVLKVGVVKKATGIDVDREGNVYVCGSSSHNVIQMSGNGTNVRELLTSSDGIKQPRAISVCGDKIVVTFTHKSAGQQNFVQIFQLV